jgi:hypothetical protein
MFYYNHIIVVIARMVYRRMIIFSHQFSPKGRAGGFHLMRY